MRIADEGTSAIRVFASAKVNLDLRVTARRPDGFHELRTVFQTLALHDMLVFRRTRGAFVLRGSAPGVPLDRTNLVWRAAEAAWAAAGRPGPPGGVTIDLHKRIPTAAGLGGGSSDAAATLIAMNDVLRLGLDPEALHNVAGTLGSDVPYFLVGGTALGLGRGEDVYPLPDLPPRFVVLVRPAFGVSTAEAYAWFATDAAARKKPRASIQRLAVPWRPSGLEVANDLESPVLARHPEIAAIRDLLLRSGAEAALMTGSGSTVFGLFPDHRVGRRVAAFLDQQGWTAILTRTLGRAVHLRRLRGRPTPRLP